MPTKYSEEQANHDPKLDCRQLICERLEILIDGTNATEIHGMSMPSNVAVHEHQIQDLAKRKGVKSTIECVEREKDIAEEAKEKVPDGCTVYCTNFADHVPQKKLSWFWKDLCGPIYRQDYKTSALKDFIDYLVKYLDNQGFGCLTGMPLAKRYRKTNELYFDLSGKVKANPSYEDIVAEYVRIIEEKLPPMIVLSDVYLYESTNGDAFVMFIVERYRQNSNRLVYRFKNMINGRKYLESSIAISDLSTQFDNAANVITDAVFGIDADKIQKILDMDLKTRSSNALMEEYAEQYAKLMNALKALPQPPAEVLDAVQNREAWKAEYKSRPAKPKAKKPKVKKQGKQKPTEGDSDMTAKQEQAKQVIIMTEKGMSSAEIADALNIEVKDVAGSKAAAKRGCYGERSKERLVKANLVNEARALLARGVSDEKIVARTGISTNSLGSIKANITKASKKA